MSEHLLPLLPGVDPAAAPSAADPGYEEWIQRVVFSPEGVDRMLIWEMLHRTPAERLGILQEWVNGILKARDGRRPEIL